MPALLMLDDAGDGNLAKRRRKLLILPVAALETDYARRYIAGGKRVVLVGAAFDPETRNLGD